MVVIFPWNAHLEDYRHAKSTIILRISTQFQKSLTWVNVVDSHYKFVWGSCGFPGNSHDAVIFRSTDLWTHIKEGFLPVIGKIVGNVTVPPLIVGDSAFSLHTWLTKPYTNAVLTPQQRNFNYHLSRACMVTVRVLMGNSRVGGGCYFKRTKAVKIMPTLLHWHAWFSIIHVLHKEMQYQKSLTWVWMQMVKRESRGNKKAVADEKLLKHQGCLSGGK